MNVEMHEHDHIQDIQMQSNKWISIEWHHSKKNRGNHRVKYIERLV